MAEEQICARCSKVDLSVHRHTDKQTEWWSKRTVILLHGCVDALVANTPSPSPLSLMPAATLRCTCRLQSISSVKCMIAEHSINSFPFKLPWAALISFYLLWDRHTGMLSVSLCWCTTNLGFFRFQTCKDMHDERRLRRRKMEKMCYSKNCSVLQRACFHSFFFQNIGVIGSQLSLFVSISRWVQTLRYYLFLCLVSALRNSKKRFRAKAFFSFSNILEIIAQYSLKCGGQGDHILGKLCFSDYLFAKFA